MVWWRSSTVRGPPPSTPSESASPARSWAGDSTRQRAAASSMASGMPSRLGADAHDVGHVLVREAEVASGSCRAIDEQADRVAVRDGLERRLRLRPEPERRYPPAQLARHVQRRAARGEDRDLGAAAQDLRRRLGARVGQVLAVVQDEQHPLSGQPPGDPAAGGRRGPRRAARPG